MKPALFVQDIQIFWLYDPESNQDLKRSVEKRIDNINGAIAWFRKKNLPVIIGYTENEAEGLVRGMPSFEVPENIDVMDTDYKTMKPHANAFASPELAAILRKEGCDSMVIVGLSASGCVLATYFSAFDSDIKPFVLKGGIASHNEEHIRFAEEICDSVRLDQLEERFG